MILCCSIRSDSNPRPEFPGERTPAGPAGFSLSMRSSAELNPAEVPLKIAKGDSVKSSPMPSEADTPSECDFFRAGIPELPGVDIVRDTACDNMRND